MLTLTISPHMRPSTLELLDFVTILAASTFAYPPSPLDSRNTRNLCNPRLTPQKQALIDGPSTGVPRQPFTYRRLVLTPYVLKKLPRSAGSSTVKKVWDASEVEAKWAKSAWCQKRQAQEKRRNTTDFERFEVMLLKKQRRRLVQVRFLPCLGWYSYLLGAGRGLTCRALSLSLSPMTRAGGRCQGQEVGVNPPHLSLSLSSARPLPPLPFCFRANDGGSKTPPSPFTPVFVLPFDV